MSSNTRDGQQNSKENVSPMDSATTQYNERAIKPSKSEPHKTPNHPQPQADEILNPDLNSTNDI